MPKNCFRDLFYLVCTLIIAIIIIVIIIIIIIIITQYNTVQFKVCFNNVVGFLKISTSLNTRLTAKTHFAVRE